jgi:serine/threonine protein kinase
LKEIALLTSLQKHGSPRLVHVLQVTEDLHHFYIVMNFVEGGNLASLLSRERMSEQRVQQLARSLLEGVAQLHSASISHNDLQPDNILLKNDEVILCDFGCASYLDGDSSSTSRERRNGNLAYKPPEVLLKNRSHGSASDMWSVGIILFYCLVGYLPFEDGSKRRLKEKIIRAEYDFSQKEWHFVTRGAKQLLSSLLHPDPQVRMNVSEALAHPWLSTPPMLVPKRSRRSLAQRVWGQLRRKPSSKTNADLSTTSTLTSIGSMEESTRRKQVERVNLSM